MIDEFPIFAVAASYASGVSTVSDASELRLKESDRIATMCGELRLLGVQALEKPDGFTIQGGTSIRSGAVNAHGDHRLAMALAVAGLAAQSPVVVQDAEMIAESFPAFISILQALGGNLEVEETPEKVLGA
jgi:3-phosphoshikimate 1-carboxyvinyltransferase